MIGQFGTTAPRLLERREDRARGAGRSTRRPCSAASSTTTAYLIDNDARFVFSFVRSAIEAGAAAANYVELVSRRTLGRPLDLPRCATSTPASEFTTSARDDRQRRRPVRRRAQPRSGASTTEHRIVYSKGIHLVVPRLTTHRPRPGAGLLRRHAAPVLRDPDGPAIGDRHDRHPGRHAVHRGRPTTTSSSSSSRSTPGSTCPRPLTVATSSPSAAGCARSSSVGGAGDQDDVDWTTLSRKHAVEVDDARAVVTIFGGKLTDCLNVGEEVAEEVEALGVPLEEDLHNWYGEPAKATRDRVLPPGPPDAARRAAHEARHRAAHRPAVAALRAAGVRPCSRRSGRTRRWPRTSWARPTTCGSSCTTPPCTR